MDLNFIKTVIKKALQNKKFLIRMAAMVIILLLKDMFGNSIIEEFVLEVEDFTPSGLLKYMKKTMSPPKLNAMDKLTMSTNSNVNKGSDTINEKTSLNGLRILHNISDFLSDEQQQRMRNNIMNFIPPKITGTQISNNVSAEMNAYNSRNCEINSNVVSTNIDSPLQMKITGSKGEFLSKTDIAECKKTNSGDIVLNYHELFDIENKGGLIIEGISYTETEVDRIINERDSEPIELMYNLKNFHENAKGALEKGELHILKEIVSYAVNLSDTFITEPSIMNNIMRGSLEKGVYSCNNTTTVSGGWGDGYFGNMAGEILIGNKGDTVFDTFCNVVTDKAAVTLANNDLYYMELKNKGIMERANNKLIFKNYWDTFVTRLEIAWEKGQDEKGQYEKGQCEKGQCDSFQIEKQAIIEGLYYVDADLPTPAGIPTGGNTISTVTPFNYGLSYDMKGSLPLNPTYTNKNSLIKGYRDIKNASFIKTTDHVQYEHSVDPICYSSTQGYATGEDAVEWKEVAGKVEKVENLDMMMVKKGNLRKSWAGGKEKGEDQYRTACSMEILSKGDLMIKF